MIPLLRPPDRKLSESVEVLVKTLADDVIAFMVGLNKGIGSAPPVASWIFVTAVLNYAFPRLLTSLLAFCRNYTRRIALLVCTWIVFRLLLSLIHEVDERYGEHDLYDVKPSTSTWMSVFILLLAGLALASSVRYTLSCLEPACVPEKIEKATNTNGNAVLVAARVTSKPLPLPRRRSSSKRRPRRRSSSKRRPPSLPPRVRRLSQRDARTHPRRPKRQLSRESARLTPLSRWTSNPALSRVTGVELNLCFRDNVRPRFRPVSRITAAIPPRICHSANWLSPPNRVGKRMRINEPTEMEWTGHVDGPRKDSDAFSSDFSLS